MPPAKKSPRFTIDILLKCSRLKLDEAKLKALTRAILRDLHRNAPRRYQVPATVRHLSIVIVNDAQMRVLNRTYRAKDKPTDVLSFSQLEGEGISESLGDVVIATQTTKRQAAEYGVTVPQEFLRLLIHGILHLHGYDHEQVSAKEVRDMQRMEDILFDAHKKKLTGVL
jgi:probable rRNA maturation factor